jgi:trehalose 2-sulfotransferase
MTSKYKNTLLREAFGVDDDYAISDDDINALRDSFRGIAPYVILFTARSGSTFLTHEISATKALSVPNEWFSWLYVREDMEKNGGTPVDFIRRLVTSKKSEAGIFGVETNRLMLELFEDLLPVQKLFPRRLRWFFLRRRNVVAQSISNYLADKSRVFHSYQIDSHNTDKIAAVPYDGDELKKYILNFIKEEQWAINRLASMRVLPFNLFYEDIVSNPKPAAMAIANVMGVWLPDSYMNQNIENPMKKISGQKSQDFEYRFREENADFLKEALAMRPKVLVPASSI